MKRIIGYLLCASLFIPAVSLAQEEPVDQPAPEADASATTDTAPAAEPAAALAAEPAAAPAAEPVDTKVRVNEWQLQVAGGPEFLTFANDYAGVGFALKLAAQKAAFRGNFLIGGGPSLIYSFIPGKDQEEGDKVHQFLFNGDFIIGGGAYEKFGIYAHFLLGLGAISGYDADTDDTINTFYARATAGVGAFVHVAPVFSIGVLADFGFPVMDILLTLNFHVGKKHKG